MTEANRTEDLQLKRYEVFTKDDLGYRGHALSEENLDGEWVKYEDVQGIFAFIGGYLMEHRGMLEGQRAHRKIIDAVLHLEAEIRKL